MYNFPRFRFHAALAVLVFSFATVSLSLSIQEPKTADEWYEYVQKLRSDNSKFWAGDKVSQDDLKTAVKNFQAILKVLHDPKIADFRKQSLELRVKDQDIYADLAVTYAKLNDSQGVQDTLRTLLKFYADPVNEGANPGFEWQTIKNADAVKAIVKSDKKVADLLDELKWVDPHWVLMSRSSFYTDYKEKLPLEDRIAGLSQLWAEVKFNFAYFDNVRFEWDKAYKEAITKVVAAENTFDYYQVLRELCFKLGDGHTNVYFPDEIANVVYAERPPVRTEYIEGKVIVRSVRSAEVAAMGIHVGDELLEVDGEPVEKYAATSMGQFESCSTPQDHLVRLYDYFLLLGPTDKPAVLTFKDAKGNVKTFTVARTGYKDLVVPKGYEFEVLGGSVARVVINDFEHPEYVAQLKADLKAHPEVKAVAFDMRMNGGGNSGIGAEMLTGFISKPIQMYPSEVRVYSPLNRAWGAPQTYVKRPAWSVDPSTDWQFRGPVCVLIGPRTFSAAEDFTSMFIGSKLGPVIGEPSAGSTGQPYFMWLPGGGSARICVKRDRLPDGRKFVGVGIQPDIVVKKTVADVRAGKDAVLDRAISELKSRLNK